MRAGTGAKTLALGCSVRLWAKVPFVIVRGRLSQVGDFTMQRFILFAALLGVLLDGCVLLETRQVAFAEVAAFTFTTINFPGNNFTEASGINPRGQIVGD